MLGCIKCDSQNPNSLCVLLSPVGESNVAEMEGLGNIAPREVVGSKRSRAANGLVTSDLERELLYVLVF